MSLPTAPNSRNIVGCHEFCDYATVFRYSGKPHFGCAWIIITLGVSDRSVSLSRLGRAMSDRFLHIPADERLALDRECFPKTRDTRTVGIILHALLCFSSNLRGGVNEENEGAIGWNDRYFEK